MLSQFSDRLLSYCFSQRHRFRCDLAGPSQVHWKLVHWRTVFLYFHSCWPSSQSMQALLNRGEMYERRWGVAKESRYFLEDSFL